MRKIMYSLFIGVILFIGLSPVSCSKKEVKQVSQESKITLEAFALAETIKNAFLKNDRTTLQENSTEAGYKDITANKKTFDSVELTFTPKWVEIENTKLTLDITWKSTWIISGRRTEDRGMAVFIMEGRPLKVSKILRLNPFIYPGH